MQHGELVVRRTSEPSRLRVAGARTVGGAYNALANVGRVLTIVAKLSGLSPALDARDARATADRLLLYWQSRVGA